MMELDPAYVDLAMTRGSQITGKEPQRVLFQSLPADRILVETDAPDLVPPAEYNRWPLTHPETGAAVNHPANLVAAYEALAALRGVPVPELSATVAQNWQRLFC